MGMPMSASNFDTCLHAILREEGSNSDDPQDHGGRTSRGVTQREYDAYRAKHGQQTADVWQATDEEIKDIYYRQYWNPYCDELVSGVDLIFFDCSVNAGRQQAVKDLQRALGITADGMFGLRTQQAVSECPDIPRLIKDYAERRRAFYRALRQFPLYGRGWLARVDRIESQSLALADKKPVEAPVDQRVGKATASDLDQPTVPPEGGAAISGGSATAAGALNQFKDQISPYSDTIKIVQYILIIVALAGLGFTIWGFIKARRNKQVA
jgi:lysozyme family protein